MKFVLAPDSFKESITSIEACDAMERGIKKIFPEAECIKVPMADGGEGTLDALVKARDGKIYFTEVTAPLGNKVNARVGVLGNGDIAVIEMAEASGIHLVKREERNPLITSTYGTGELIKKALDLKAKHIVIGIGGSATNDGGAGMIQALGGKLLDKDGRDIELGGGALDKLYTIDISNLDPRLKSTKIEVACDVTNPLVGKRGASAVFGPQKGANEEMIEKLDNNLRHYGEVIKKDIGKDIIDVPGSGAAGGLGAALLAFLDAELVSGIELVMKHTELSEKVNGADYLLTGEGSIDDQTIYGKVPSGVAKLANEHGVKTIAFAGRIGNGIEELYNIGICGIFNILSEVVNLEKALETGKENIEKTVENVMRIIALK